MPSPFPGMDPWLEDPAIWSDFHTRLAVRLSEDLAPSLAPRYFVAVEQRMYLAQPDELVFVGRPDLAVIGTGDSGGRGDAAGQPVPQVVTLPIPEPRRERYLEIRDAGTGEIVTVLEILSPANKNSGRGRDEYEEKRGMVLGTRTHLVEIDLVRTGRPPAMTPESPPGQYAVLVSRSWRRPTAERFPFGLRDPIPRFALPLRKGEPEPGVDLKAAIDAVYDAARYDLRLRYSAPPIPPLAPADLAWAGERVR